jgi:hypothetical protein
VHNLGYLAIRAHHRGRSRRCDDRRELPVRGPFPREILAKLLYLSVLPRAPSRFEGELGRVEARLSLATGYWPPRGAYRFERWWRGMPFARSAADYESGSLGCQFPSAGVSALPRARSRPL